MCVLISHVLKEIVLRVYCYYHELQWAFIQGILTVVPLPMGFCSWHSTLSCRGLSQVVNALSVSGSYVCVCECV